LGINSPSSGFIVSVEELSRRREVRNREILDRMHELNIDASWEELITLSDDEPAEDISNHSFGRPHFAALLVKKRIVRNINQAFNHYLGVGKPLYVPKVGMHFEEAITIIRESGGIPILAHPISLYVAWGRLPDLIKTLKEMGLMGLEAWHPTAKISSCHRLEDLAKKLGLYVTEGSDFHGSTCSDRKLGYSSKDRKISDSILEAIPELAPNKQ
jgi:predicted metal-dependent phosphoesterase TrpH